MAETKKEQLENRVKERKLKLERAEIVLHKLESGEIEVNPFEIKELTQLAQYVGFQRKSVSDDVHTLEAIELNEILIRLRTELNENLLKTNLLQSGGCFEEIESEMEALTNKLALTYDL